MAHQKIAKIGKRISQCEQVLRLVKNPSGSYYIDQTTVNTLLTGMTRSGKGETFVNVMVDILSRAQLQASMVIGDPKGELFQMASGTLRKRGYNVQVLNYQNVDFSMSNNPLQLAKAYAQKVTTKKYKQKLMLLQNPFIDKLKQKQVEMLSSGKIPQCFFFSFIYGNDLAGKNDQRMGNCNCSQYDEPVKSTGIGICLGG